MTALIIDDEIQIRRLLRMALESKGYTIREAENGTLGLQAAVFHKPDVILLDLGLPDMDGVDVLKRLREWSATPVLIRASLEIGPLVLDPVQHAATLSGSALKLTPTEYALLAQLVKHAGKVVTLKQLLRAVWGPQAEQQSNYLRVYANHLRKKLEGSSLEIRNEPGIGYRLVSV